MMFRKLLNKSKTEPSSDATSKTMTDKAAIKIANAIAFIQNGFAMFMNKKTQHYSQSTWKILIVVFGACWSVLCLYFFSAAFIQHPAVDSKSTNISASHVSILKPTHNNMLEWMELIYQTQSDSLNKKIRQMQYNEDSNSQTDK